MDKFYRLPVLIFGIICGITAPLFYFLNGFSLAVLLLWLAGIIVSGLSLYHRPGKVLNFGKPDGYAIGLLILLAFPLYFAYLYTVPFQMNTDEAAIMMFQRQYAETADIFGLSTYFGFPSFIFTVTGWLANLFGGISIYTVRIVHASMGLLIVLGAYMTFRQFWKPLLAFSAALVLGVNHSLVAISRMAMRDNSALLVAALALPFLFYGLRQKNHFFTFVGGVIAGFSFYVYHPGRIFIFTWVGFLLLLALFRKQPVRFLAKHLVIVLFGFTLVYAPLFAAGIKHTDPGSSKFNRERFLFYEEGRQLQQLWVAAPTVREGVIINIKNGLTTFNNKIDDKGYIYPNIGFGFVDPVTGSLLWIGVLGILVNLVRRKSTTEDIWALSGFLFLWLLFAFVINKSPNYTRLLITLPFVAYLAVSGIQFAAHWLARLLRLLKFHNEDFVLKFLLVPVLLLTAATNLYIFAAFAQKDPVETTAVGETARHIESKKDHEQYAFLLVSDQYNLYYDWGNEGLWQSWMKVFAQDSQIVQVVNPYTFMTVVPNYKNLTIFTTGFIWQQNEAMLRSYYPDLVAQKLTPDGGLMAIEIINTGVSP